MRPGPCWLSETCDRISTRSLPETRNGKKGAFSGRVTGDYCRLQIEMHQSGNGKEVALNSGNEGEVKGSVGLFLCLASVEL